MSHKLTIELDWTTLAVSNPPPFGKNLHVAGIYSRGTLHTPFVVETRLRSLGERDVNFDYDFGKSLQRSFLSVSWPIHSR